jgi:septin family protein
MVILEFKAYVRVFQLHTMQKSDESCLVQKKGVSSKTYAVICKALAQKGKHAALRSTPWTCMHLRDPQNCQRTE